MKRWLTFAFDYDRFFKSVYRLPNGIPNYAKLDSALPTVFEPYFSSSFWEGPMKNCCTDTFDLDEKRLMGHPENPPKE